MLEIKNFLHNIKKQINATIRFNNAKIYNKKIVTMFSDSLFRNVNNIHNYAFAANELC